MGLSKGLIISLVIVSTVLFIGKEETEKRRRSLAETKTWKKNLHKSWALNRQIFFHLSVTWLQQANSKAKKWGASGRKALHKPREKVNKFQWTKSLSIRYLNWVLDRALCPMKPPSRYTDYVSEKLIYPPRGLVRGRDRVVCLLPDIKRDNLWASFSRVYPG